LAPLTRRALSSAAVHLAARDRDLARILAEDGVPPLWARRPGFKTLVRIILEQQVSLASARAVFRRLETGAGPLTPERLLAAGPARLRRLGITRQKAAYCVNLARALNHGGFDLRALMTLDDDAARARLLRIKGIGPWTTDIYLLMAMRRPDIWPGGDVALAKAVRVVKGLRTPPTSARLQEMAEEWRPFRAVAARMFWHHYLRNGLSRRQGGRRTDRSTPSAQTTVEECRNERRSGP
jgi:DNA-3-methyladenine glycosylase II